MQISVTVFGIVNSIGDEHLQKALSSIIVAPFGIVIDLHLEKAYLQISVTLFGIIIFVIDLHPENASSPISLI